MPNQNKNLEKFFSPSSIVIVGATDGEGKVGKVITENILNLGYGGEVYLVNPKRRRLFDRECFSQVTDIKKDVDLAIIIVPAQIVNKVVREASKITRNFIVISAGFSETGKEGKKRESELGKIARVKNLTILGPNCLGFILPKLKLNASFSGGLPKRGNIAFITQSGALATAFMDIFAQDNIGFSGVVSIGNKMQIDEGDLIEYFGADPETKVIGLYLEGIKYGPKFIETALKVSKEKPIVILKAGKNEKTQKAIALHTGALAGSDKITGAVFEKCAILQAANSRDFISLLKLISLSDLPANNSVAIITNAGGAGVLAADAFENGELEMAEISPNGKNKLLKFLPPAASVENPVDVLGDADAKRYCRALEVIGTEDAEIIFCLLTPQKQTPVEKIADGICEFFKKSQKNVITCFMGGEKVKGANKKFSQNGIVNFDLPEEAVKNLGKYCQWHELKNTLHIRHSPVNHFRRKTVRGIIEKALAKNDEALTFEESAGILKLYGLNTVRYWTAANLSGICYPAVVKVDSSRVLHKTEKKGVIAGVKNHSDLLRAIEKIKTHFPGEKFIVQEESKGHFEIILGVKKDLIFGPIVAFGLGGIYTEVFKMVDFLIPPFSIQDAEKKIKRSGFEFLFRKTRGMKEYNLYELAHAVTLIGALAGENPEISELDINPFFIYNDGRKGLAADIKIIL
jgi:acetyl coenzyme A synthetase (ADP forming)-like protein